MASQARTLYILFVGGAAPPPDGLDLHGDGHRLDERLFLVRSALTRSQLYHRMKRQLPGETPLLVAPLAEPPKFKGMRAGALKWLRAPKAPYANDE